MKNNIFFCLLFVSTFLSAKSQDTIIGNYKNLIINKGFHLVTQPLIVNGNLEVMAGSNIEFVDPGVLVCNGNVFFNGNINEKIVINGNLKSPGIGIVIKNDSDSSNDIYINNTMFTNLQKPLFFEFGWKRKNVSIKNNYFVNNIGNVSVIEVLNPPFNINDTLFHTDFKMRNNLFSNNNAPIYFEDFNSDYINIEISNNTFYSNYIFGINNYNISSNFLNGRIDQKDYKYKALIVENSFLNNYLFDFNSGNFIHYANIGIYGTSKLMNLKNNYWGFSNKKDINNSIYDNKNNYYSPEVEFEPFFLIPKESNPSYIYSISDFDDKKIIDTQALIKPTNGFVFKSNNLIDYTKSKLKYTYFNKSKFQQIDTFLNINIETVNLTTKLTIITKFDVLDNVGFYTLSNLKNSYGEFVPDVKIGYLSFINETNKLKLTDNKQNYNINTILNSLTIQDSLKNIFQKVEFSSKNRIELSVITGGSIFLGTISNKSVLLNNDINPLFGININYTLNSNLTGSLNFEKFNLSNSDKNSNNTDQLARGMSFNTTMFSISPSLNYDFIDNRIYTKARKLRSSIGFGLDIFKFNPTGIYNGIIYNLQSLGTGGQLSDDTKNPYSLTSYGYFFSFKLKHQLNRYNSIGLQISYHRSITDYLDDVGSDKYPNPSFMLNSIKLKNKDIAIYFSNPTSRNVFGQYRNSPDDSSDNFLNFNFFYSIKLFN